MNEHRRSKVVANRSYCTVPTGIVLYSIIFCTVLYGMHARMRWRQLATRCTTVLVATKLKYYKHSDKLPLTAIYFRPLYFFILSSQFILNARRWWCDDHQNKQKIKTCVLPSAVLRWIQFWTKKDINNHAILSACCSPTISIVSWHGIVGSLFCLYVYLVVGIHNWIYMQFQLPS